MNNIGATPFPKKNQIDCLSACSPTDTVDSMMNNNNNNQSFSSNSDNNNNSSRNLVGEASIMALGDSNLLGIDEDLHKCQLAMHGRETMRRLSASNVLISRILGLGVEIVKNLILAGVNSVTVLAVSKGEMGMAME